MAGKATTQACQRFPGKVALLTAAASGIGAATAERLAAEGATVVVTDVEVDAGEQIVERIVAGGGSAVFRRLDVTSPEDWAGCVAATLAEHGHLDVVHLNAGGSVIGPLGEITDESWDRQVSLCLRSAMLGARACLPALRAARGAVVITSSIHGSRGFPGFPAYAAAKGALEALTRQLAVEYGPDVRFNAVAPGAILTPMWNATPESVVEDAIARTPLSRLGAPEEVAAAVAFLASADASFITGVTLTIDGGRTVAERG